MILLEDLSLIKEKDVIGALIRVIDYPNRDIVTVTKDNTFLGVLSYEFYADNKVFAYSCSLDNSKTHYVIRCNEEEVFKASLVLSDESLKGKNILEEEVEEEIFKYRIFSFKKGPWIDHLCELDKIMCEESEDTRYPLEIMREKYPAPEKLDISPIISTAESISDLEAA